MLQSFFQSALKENEQQQTHQSCFEVSQANKFEHTTSIMDLSSSDSGFSSDDYNTQLNVPNMVHGVDLNNPNYVPPMEQPNQAPPVNESLLLYQQAGAAVNFLLQNAGAIYDAAVEHGMAVLPAGPPNPPTNAEERAQPLGDVPGLAPLPPPANEDNSRKRQSSPCDYPPEKVSKCDASTVSDPDKSPKPGPSSANNFAPIDESAATQSTTSRQEQDVSLVPVQCRKWPSGILAAAMSGDAAAMKELVASDYKTLVSLFCSDMHNSEKPGPSSAMNFAPIDGPTQETTTRQEQDPIPLATSTPRHTDDNRDVDDSVLHASTIQLDASVTRNSGSEFELDSSPLRDMSEDWSLTSSSSPDIGSITSSQGARRRLDMSLVSSNSEDSSDPMENLLTPEQQYMRDFVDMVRGNVNRLAHATLSVHRIRMIGTLHMASRDRRRIRRLARQLSCLVRTFREHRFLHPSSDTEEE